MTLTEYKRRVNVFFERCKAHRLAEKKMLAAALQEQRRPFKLQLMTDAHHQRLARINSLAEIASFQTFRKVYVANIFG